MTSQDPVKWLKNVHICLRKLGPRSLRQVKELVASSLMALDRFSSDPEIAEPAIAGNLTGPGVVGFVAFQGGIGFQDPPNLQAGLLGAHSLVQTAIRIFQSQGCILSWLGKLVLQSHLWP